MKKIINDPTAVVDEMLEGLAYIHSDLVYRVEGFDIILTFYLTESKFCHILD